MEYPNPYSYRQQYAPEQPLANTFQPTSTPRPPVSAVALEHPYPGYDDASYAETVPPTQPYPARSTAIYPTTLASDPYQQLSAQYAHAYQQQPRQPPPQPTPPPHPQHPVFPPGALAYNFGIPTNASPAMSQPGQPGPSKSREAASDPSEADTSARRPSVPAAKARNGAVVAKKVPPGAKDAAAVAEHGYGAEPEEGNRSGRKSNSCAPCRKRKMRCDRCSPCSSCTSRGDPDACTWEDAQPLYSLRTDNDVQELKDQVHRLQGLVDSLTGHLRSTTSSPAGSDGVSPPSAAGSDEVEVDMRAGDLCSALSQLAISGVIPQDSDTGVQSFAPGGASGDCFIEEARKFVSTYSERTGRYDPTHTPPHHDSPDSDSNAPANPPWNTMLSPLHTSPSSITDIVAFLPNQEESEALLEIYIQLSSWFQHPFNLISFRSKCDELLDVLALPPEERDQRIDLGFVATFCASCAAGMERVVRGSAPLTKLGPQYETLEVRKMLWNKWSKGAMMALTAARFVEDPTIEAIRAVMIITTQSLWISPGEMSGAALGLLSIAVQGAFAIGMHRDPGRNNKYTFLEAEDRRSVFWNLFSQCMTSTWIFGCSWHQFDISRIDCAMPLDCHDFELHQDERAARAAVSRRAAKAHLAGSTANSDETDMTVLLYKAKVALLTKKSDDAAFGLKPVKHSVVLDFHRQLEEIEATVPLRYQLEMDEDGVFVDLISVHGNSMRAGMIQVIFAMGFVRLHRPWLVLGGTDDRYAFSRTTAVKYAKRLVAMHTSPIGIMNLGGHNYKTISCTVLLAIEMLQTTDHAEAEVLHHWVLRALANLTTWRDVSTICRKGVNVIHFLLRKYTDKDAKVLAPRDAKRSRTSVASTPTTAAHPLFDAFTWTSDYVAPSDEDRNQGQQRQDELPHKRSASHETSQPFPTTTHGQSGGGGGVRRIALGPVRNGRPREFWEQAHVAVPQMGGEEMERLLMQMGSMEGMRWEGAREESAQQWQAQGGSGGGY